MDKTEIKNHRRTIFAAKNPSLFRDSQLRSAVSLVCSIIVALRPCRKPLPKHFEKYFLTISPPFLIVNAPLFPSKFFRNSHKVKKFRLPAISGRFSIVSVSYAGKRPIYFV